MIKNLIFHNYYEELNENNRMFNHANAPIGDELLLPMIVLKEYAAKRGITIGTHTVISLDQADAVVFIDMPDFSSYAVRKILKSKKPCYLIVCESKIVRPQNYNPHLLIKFKKIFTYDDSLVDGKRFIKLNYAFDLPKKLNIDIQKKEKKYVMIAGNKMINHPQELYSKRIEVIRWFERNHPVDFDLYGIGWDEHLFKGSWYICKLNYFRWLRRLCAPSYPSYRGSVLRKRSVMKKYRYAFCYENVSDVPGYITEKIFDSFFAGCVPIYWGANNINDKIPSSCFIDKRKFDSYEELYKYTEGMAHIEYKNYLESIRNFLSGNQSSHFSCETFSKTLIDHIDDN